MREIRISLENATENQIFWLEKLLEEEIEQARGAAENEHLWALGSDDENAAQHEEYSEENREYAGMLENVLKQLRDIR